MGHLYIWIVEFGSRHGGVSSTYHQTFDGAKKAATEFMEDHYPGTWGEYGENFWQSDGDCLKIFEVEVGD